VDTPISSTYILPAELGKEFGLAATADFVSDQRR
jgi:hypothetical protein